VVSTGVRRRSFNVLVALCVASCGACGAAPSRPIAATSGKPSASRDGHIVPSNIRRLRPEFPPGYEVTDVPEARSPLGYWGFGNRWTADPAQCAALADPVAGDAPAQGLAGSGRGGIVYAVVATAASPLDRGLVAQCTRWSITGGRASATVDLVPAPEIGGAPTVGMSTAVRTVVEGGTETDAQIQTLSAYLGEYVAFVVVVTDPGAPQNQLPPDFGAELLAKVVAALRG
jgi:Domain of unknown function (DUF5642)